MAPRIPEVPHDKLYHLFVCYEKKSLNIVQRIVDNLETNGIVCCYYDRDFLPGQSILNNIYDGIKQSSTMLIVLSEDFENSVYCKHEVEEAINLKVRGEYSLIPIKTEPCSVPERLQHLVYIDVEDDIDGAHNKIIDAIVNKDIREESKEDRNGEYLRFSIKTYRPNKLSLRRYKLEFTDKRKSKIWSNNFEVSTELLQDIEDTVNSSLLVQYLHVWRYSYLYILMIFLLLLILIAISVLIVFITTSGRERADSFQPTEYLLAIGFPLWFASLIVSEVLCFYHDISSKGLFSIKRKAVMNLRAELWHKSKENNAQTGVIFLLGSVYSLVSFTEMLTLPDI